MSERSERIAKFVQILLSAATEGDTHEIMPRMYRSAVFDALADSRKALPRDLGALALVLQSSELFARGLYFIRGSDSDKVFSGEGFHQLMAWLSRCTALFAQFEEVYADLPPMPDTDGDVRAAAKSYAIQCDRLYANIGAHVAQYEDEQSGRAADEIEPPSVHIQGRTLKDIITVLGMVMCAWFDAHRLQHVMNLVFEGSEELYRCRTIIEDGSVKGNA